MEKPLDSKKILLIGGTPEGRELFSAGLPLVYSAAARYGAEFVDSGDDEEAVMPGRMDELKMLELLKSGEFAGVIDAAHPDAAEVRLNIQRACEAAGVPLFRILGPATGIGPECDSRADIPSGSMTDAWSWAVSLPGVEFGRSSRGRAVKHTRVIRVGSRESVLAAAQAKSVMELISRHHPEFKLELVTMKTKGDSFSELFPSSAASSGRQSVKGMFVKELESALLDGSIDLAVHSLKDMSLEENGELPIVAYTAREDPRDVVVTRSAARGASSGIRAIDGAFHRSAGRTSVNLSGFVAGCSSPRRRIQLRRVAGCGTIPVRGNVITRLERLDSGERGFDFLVLAAAGLIRLGMRGRIDYYFPADMIIPAAGQGVLACQGRAGEDYGYIASVNDPTASARAASERAFASAAGGGCSSPVAAYAEADGGEILLLGLFADEERGIYSRGGMRGPIERARELGERLAEKIMSRIDDGWYEDE
jgi:hydroxymethylbilane synthase